MRLGWTPERETEFEQYRDDGLRPARVAVEHRSAYVLYGEQGEFRAELAGRLRHEEIWPAVGDWVGVREPATIYAVLPRRTVSPARSRGSRRRSRCLPRTRTPVFVTMALTHTDFKPRRLERYLATAWESGAEPAIVLTKTDLCDDVETAVLEVEAVAFGVPIHALNGLTGEGIEALSPYLAGHRTVALLGSSGVGKSTIVNHLAGGLVMPTNEIGSDGRGRHTTRHRELLPLPAAGSCSTRRASASSSSGTSRRVSSRPSRTWPRLPDLPLRRLRARERAGLRSPRGATERGFAA
jgi:ribosome biogenesis GTPase